MVPPPVRTKVLRYQLTPVTSIAESEGRCFLLPAMAGLAPETVDLLGCLPITNVNGQLIDYLATPGARPETIDFACVFGADPFYDAAQLVEDLRTANISGIANLPSLGILEGRFAEVMSASGFDFQRELQCLGFAKRQGLRVSAFVWNEQQGVASLQAHADQLVVHPGGLLRQAPTREEAASAVLDLIRKLQQQSSGEIPILLYRHPSLYGELATAADIADGIIVYASQFEP
jgi:predicted TIM-barrel enzyme